MKFQRTCEHCQHNFGGFCTAKGFGQPVDSDDATCELWEISDEFLADAVDAAPWYLKRPYKAGKLEQQDFLSRLEQDAAGLPVEIGIYDAIEEVYGLTQQRLADILGVSSDVVGYARSKGTVARRIPHFAKCLHIPEELFRSFTTADLPTLEQCRKDYEKQFLRPEENE